MKYVHIEFGLLESGFSPSAVYLSFNDLINIKHYCYILKNCHFIRSIKARNLSWRRILAYQVYPCLYCVMIMDFICKLCKCVCIWDFNVQMKNKSERRKSLIFFVRLGWEIITHRMWDGNWKLCTHSVLVRVIVG